MRQWRSKRYGPVRSGHRAREPIRKQWAAESLTRGPVWTGQKRWIAYLSGRAPEGRSRTVHPPTQGVLSRPGAQNALVWPLPPVGVWPRCALSA